jgi:hypothetical protein
MGSTVEMVFFDELQALKKDPPISAPEVRTAVVFAV